MVYRWTEAARTPVPHERTRWIRVSRQRPCPVCGKPDWCSIADHGGAAVCMRVADGAMHQIDIGHGLGHIHDLGHEMQRPAPPVYRRPPPRRWELDFEAIFHRWREAPAHLDVLSDALGLSVDSLARLDVAYDDGRQAWAFPMHDDRRRIIGVRYRTADGRKFALPGSRSGAFIPRDLNSRSLLLICEGPTDVAAALMLGFQALGRPSCTGATEIICDLLGVGRRRDVVIVADNDGPGHYGANRLADRIVGICRTVKMISPAPHKDLRDWVRAGAVQGEVEARITESGFHRTERVDARVDQG